MKVPAIILLVLACVSLAAAQDRPAEAPASQSAGVTVAVLTTKPPRPATRTWACRSPRSSPPV